LRPVGLPHEAKAIFLVKGDRAVVSLECPKLQLGKVRFRTRQQGSAETAALMRRMNVKVLNPAVAKCDEAGNFVLVCYPDFTGGKYARTEENAVLVRRMEDGKKRQRRIESDAEYARDAVDIGWGRCSDHEMR
jgi:hypothetical protein